MESLSVILISRDQEWNIARLIESVLQETVDLSGTEVVLVDSASSDRTVELASRYPITVLRLHVDQPLSPAAGRYVGYGQTRGDLILFLDGDMELCPGWLGQALQVSNDEPRIAGVTGLLHELPLGAPGPATPAEGGAAAIRELTHYGGGVLHRRSALEAVGGFNPYLRSDEEPELCVRLRHEGFRIVELGRPMAYHYSSSSTSVSTLLGRRRRGLYLGAGQALRYQIGKPSFGAYVRERGFGLVPGLALVAGIGSLAVARLTGNRLWSRGWTLTALTVLGLDSYRKRSPRRTFFSLVLRLLILEGTIHGFWSAPREPSSYPGRFDVVKRGHAFSHATDQA